MIGCNWKVHLEIYCFIASVVELMRNYFVLFIYKNKMGLLCFFFLLCLILGENILGPCIY